jgi:hypothetical protein
MSCYEWERGEIVLPRGEWSSFRKSLIKDHNDRLMADFNRAVDIHAKITEACKGLRGKAREEKQKQALQQLTGFNAAVHSWGNEKYEVYLRMEALLFPYDQETRSRSKLVLPKKKDLGLLPLTGDCTISLADASIFIRNESYTIKWVVPENNHACEHARKHPTAKKLFVLLHQVKWTRGTGGTIVGNDEYNRDSAYEGGGANFVKDRFGVESAAEKRLRNAVSPWDYWRSR